MRAATLDTEIINIVFTGNRIKSSKSHFKNKQYLLDYINNLYINIDMSYLDKLRCIVYQTEPHLCNTCQKNYTKWDSVLQNFREYCSLKCQSNNEDVKNKRIKTNLTLYGFENSAQVQQFKDKIVKTNLKRYGVKHVLASKQVIQQRQETCMLKYGGNNSTYKDFNIDALKYLQDYNWMYIQYKVLNKQSYDIAKELNIHHATVCRWINKHNIELNDHWESSGEKELKEFIEQYYQTKKLFKFNGTHDIDIFIPELMLGIEYNGLYWHSNANKRITKDYHLNKQIDAYKQKIDLRFINEYQWLNQKDICKSYILNLLGQSKQIYARKCVIKEVININDVQNFYNLNHFQGYKLFKGLHLGLYYQDILVSLMSFIKPWKNQNYDFELIRFASLNYHHVVGGASKLFKYFTNKFPNKSIISYADKIIFTGNLYNKLGFSLLKETNPDYYYTKGLILENKYNYRLSKIQQKFNISGMSEKEAMTSLKYFRYYDCGKKIYVYQ